MTLFCRHKGFKVKVGTFVYNEFNGSWVFTKNKPYLMRIIGPRGGYGIQREVTDELGKKHDIRELFKKYPETIVEIIDSVTGNWWKSKANDWLEHFHKGNYGEGNQIFLSVDYMNKIN